MATLTPVVTPENGRRSVSTSTAPRPTAPTPKSTAEAVATRLAAVLRAAERARACTAARWRLAHRYSMANTGQRERYDQQARPGRHQKHHADGEDYYACDGDRDPAEQPDQVLHVCKHASMLMTIWHSGSTAKPMGRAATITNLGTLGEKAAVHHNYAHCRRHRPQ